LAIVDSGSSNTFITNKDLFTDFSVVHNVTRIKSATGHATETKGIGYVGELKGYYTPDFTNCLLSVSQICDMGHIVVFTKGEVLVKREDTGQVVAEGKRIGKLYLMTMHDVGKVCKVSVAVGNDLKANHTPYVSNVVFSNVEKKLYSSFMSWHARLHINLQHLQKLVQGGHVNGIHMNAKAIDKKLSVCSHCACAKLRRKSYKKSKVEIPSDCLTIIATDLKGPIHPASLNHDVYVAVFIDTRSKYKWVYTVKSKDEVAEAFKIFHETILLPIRKTATTKAKGIQFYTIFSDGGGEFEGRFQQCCKQYGYAQSTTPAHTPELNGLTENYWRTMFGMTRAMMFAVEGVIPLNMWSYAIKYANYLLNRTLLVPITEKNKSLVKTPYEWLNDRLPDLKNVKIFGCKCYAHIPKATRPNTSLGQHAFEGYFIGFGDSQAHTALVMRSLNQTGARVVQLDYGNILYDEIVEPRKIIETGELVYADMDDLRLEVKKPRVASSADIPERDIELNRRVLTGIDDSATKSDGSSSVREEQPQLRRSNRIAERSFVVKAESKSISLKDALNSNNSEAWLKAIDTELKSVESNDVWKKCERRPSSEHNILRTQWILTVKKDENGNEVSKKARIVVLGNLAVEGIDYTDTYAPVSKLPSIRLFFSLAAQYRMFLHQIDVKVAFTNADLDEEVYIYAPQFYDMIDNTVIPGKTVLQLHRALYGLPQAPRQWFKMIDNFLQQLGYMPFTSEPCMYSRRLDNGEIALMILYVDDMVFGNTVESELKAVVEELHKRFKITDLGIPQKLLGMRVSINRLDGSIGLDTENKIEELAVSHKLHFDVEKCPLIPMSPDSKLHSESVKVGNTKAFPDDPLSVDLQKIYRSIVGKLMFIMTATRPDIAYAVSNLSRYLSKPLGSHLYAAKGVIRYLFGSKELKLIFRRVSASQYRLVAFTDSDWGANLDNRRSHSSGIVLLGFTPIYWHSLLQTTVALSTAEAEINALKETVKIVLWIRGILKETGLFPRLEATEVFEDNQAAIEIVRNPEVSKRNRHYDMSYHFIRENLQEFRTIIISYVETWNNLADIGTKALSVELFLKFREMLLQFMYIIRERK
jgi:hypothetical protein